jgi:hypothetical protein
MIAYHIKMNPVKISKFRKGDKILPTNPNMKTNRVKVIIFCWNIILHFTDNLLTSYFLLFVSHSKFDIFSVFMSIPFSIVFKLCIDVCNCSSLLMFCLINENLWGIVNGNIWGVFRTQIIIKKNEINSILNSNFSLYIWGLKWSLGCFVSQSVEWILVTIFLI